MATFGIAGEEINPSAPVYQGSDSRFYNAMPARVFTSCIHLDRPRTAERLDRYQISAKLLAAGFSWRQSRDRFNATIIAHFRSKQKINRLEFLDRVYAQSECTNTHSPLANLLIDLVRESGAARGVQYS